MVFVFKGRLGEHWDICAGLADAQAVVLLCCHTFDENTLQLLQTARLRGLPIQAVTTPHFEWPAMTEDVRQILARVPVSLDMKASADDLEMQIDTVMAQVEECVLSTRQAKAIGAKPEMRALEFPIDVDPAVLRDVDEDGVEV